MNKMLNNKKDIYKFLELLKIKNYRINDNLTVDVDGNVDISNKKLKYIPIQFRFINGYFNCSNNSLISLEGCPKEIRYTFDCSNNKLTSLKYSPKIIDGSFDCSNNELTSLEYTPKLIKRDFNCSSNKLTSLDYCPEVLRDLKCDLNYIESDPFYCPLN